MSDALTYRREIDGLRALAVVSVVLFHAGLPPFRGGFVGVDIFFVISGYLITRILLQELASGRFSLVRFYERRARRILPALYAVLIACLPVAWLSLSPDELRDFGQTLMAVLLFSANLLLASNTDYFASSAELKPLLHTWSLAVEEQYYLLLPWLMLLGWRALGRAVLVPIGLLGLASLVGSQWASSHQPQTAFYALSCRAWELTIGSVIAGHSVGLWPTKWRSASAWLGLALIALAIFGFDRNTPSPSVYTLVPTLGTALLLLGATPENTVGRLLGSRPLVAVGLISYSVYLWHQPLLAWGRHVSHEHASRLLVLGLCFATLGLAYVTWRFVEQPFRQRQRFSARWITIAALSLGAGLLAVGLLIERTEGYLGREHRRTLEQVLSDRLRPNHGLGAYCDRDFSVDSPCTTQGEPAVLVWGDSFAMHLVDGLRAANPGLALRQATWSNCGPLLGVAPFPDRYPPAWSRDCIASNDRVMAWLARGTSVNTVVLGTSFRLYLDADRRVMQRDGTTAPARAAAERALRDTVAQLRALGLRTIVIGPPPSTGQNAGLCLAHTMSSNEPLDQCDLSRAQVQAHQAAERALLARLSHATEVRSLEEVLCIGRTCQVSREGTLLYRDAVHLTPEGSRYIGSTTPVFRLDSVPSPPTVAF